ncbi:MAG: hypothetical protein NZR01_09170 [Bryobacteraceae bacterium]|nr:hypothetical protein [Bryobacteraceae bacterium]
MGPFFLLSMIFVHAVGFVAVAVWIVSGVWVALDGGNSLVRLLLLLLAALFPAVLVYGLVDAVVGTATAWLRPRWLGEAVRDIVVLGVCHWAALLAGWWVAGRAMDLRWLNLSFGLSYRAETACRMALRKSQPEKAVGLALMDTFSLLHYVALMLVARAQGAPEAGRLLAASLALMVPAYLLWKLDCFVLDREWEQAQGRA